MTLRELLYRIQGEVEEGTPENCDQEVVFQTADGQTFAPVGVASDGEVLIVNVEQ